MNIIIDTHIFLWDMPFHHRDPFDRMLISQSINRDYYLMSDDRKFGDYDLKLIWYLGVVYRRDI
jgi:PIN domain nuclease of toxin-antitoxin system